MPPLLPRQVGDLQVTVTSTAGLAKGSVPRLHLSFRILHSSSLRQEETG